MYRKINKLAKITLGEMWKRSKGVIGHFKKKLESVEVLSSVKSKDVSAIGTHSGTFFIQNLSART